MDIQESIPINQNFTYMLLEQHMLNYTVQYYSQTNSSPVVTVFRKLSN
jgi:hypothetical protein